MKRMTDERLAEIERAVQFTAPPDGAKQERAIMQNGTQTKKETNPKQKAEKSDGSLTCEFCKRFFSQFSCAKSVYLECDCPKCMGYCECYMMEQLCGNTRRLDDA